MVLRIFKNNAFINTSKAADTSIFGTTMFTTFCDKKGCSNMAAIALFAICHFVLVFGARGVAQQLTGHVEFLLPHLSRVTPCLPRSRSKCHLGEDAVKDNKIAKIIPKHPGTNNFAGVEYFRVVE